MLVDHDRRDQQRSRCVSPADDFSYPQGIIPGSGEGYGVSLSKGRTIGGPLLLLVE